MVSGQSFGSSTVSLACITSVCSVQRFPGGHSLRLAFGSLFYRLILAVLLLGQAVSFFVVFGYAWLLCNRCFLVICADNIGGTFVSAFGDGFFVWVIRLQLDGSKVGEQLGGGVFARRSDRGFAFTRSAVQRFTNVVVKRSTSLAGQAVYELSS